MPSFQGTLHKIEETKEYGSKGFTKREFVIAAGDNLVPFEFVWEDCNRLDGFQEGESVTVEYEPQGREYNDRYYVNLRCTNITADRVQQPLVADDEEIPF